MGFVTDWLSDTRKLVTGPSRFFREVDRSRGIGYAFGYALLSYAVGAALIGAVNYAIASAIGSAGIPGLPGSLVLSPVDAAIKSLQTFIGGLILLLLAALIIHVVVYAFGGRDVKDTLEPVLYSSSVYAVFGWIPLVSILGFFYGLYVKARGLEAYHEEISFGEGLVAVIVPAALAVILFLVVMLLAAALFASVIGGSTLPATGAFAGAP